MDELGVILPTIQKTISVPWQPQRDPNVPKRPRGWRKARAAKRRHVRNLDKSMLLGGKVAEGEEVGLLG